jgi:hypothetical protein
MRARLLILIAVVGLLASVTAQAVAPVAPADAEASASASGPEGKSAPVSEVTVIARRLKLESRITDFVYGISVLQNLEGVARWQAPVCPLVTGLARQQGEFVLERLSEIARRAAVPLAGAQCRPNLFIFVTSEPKQLLQAMEKRYFAVTFGNATPSQVDEFINTPRPVRVWHSPYWTPNGGTPQGHGLPPSAQFLGGSVSGPPTYSTPGGVGASRLIAPGSWTFGNVYVIVDQAQLRGVSQGQFADYIAMVSLAEIKPTAHPGDDAHSILTLFAGTPQSAPAGMSDWDQAFLKSLYGADPEATRPRSLISRGMMRELVP